MEMLPGKKLSYSLRPVWEDATDEKEKNYERLHLVRGRLFVLSFRLLSVPSCYLVLPLVYRNSLR